MWACAVPWDGAVEGSFAFWGSIPLVGSFPPERCPLCSPSPLGSFPLSVRLPLSECSPPVGSFPLELSPPSRSSFKPRPGSTLSGFGFSVLMTFGLCEQVISEEYV